MEFRHRGAPSLRAIAPSITWSDPRNGLLFRGGAIEHGLNVRWSFLMAASHVLKADLPTKTVAQIFADFDELVPRTYSQLPAGDVPAIGESLLPGIGVERARRDPASLAESDVSSRIDEVPLPSLTTTGWYDVFLQGSLDNYSAMRSRGRTARLVVGPWCHLTYNNAWAGGQVGEVNFGLAAAAVDGKTITQVQRNGSTAG